MLESSNVNDMSRATAYRLRKQIIRDVGHPCQVIQAPTNGRYWVMIKARTEDFVIRTERHLYYTLCSHFFMHA